MFLINFVSDNFKISALLKINAFHDIKPKSWEIIKNNLLQYLGSASNETFLLRYLATS